MHFLLILLVIFLAIIMFVFIALGYVVRKVKQFFGFLGGGQQQTDFGQSGQYGHRTYSQGGNSRSNRGNSQSNRGNTEDLIKKGEGDYVDYEET